MSSVSDRVDQLTKDVKSIQNGSVSEIADLHSSLHSLMDSMAADRTTVSLSMDHHMDHLKSKISSVEEELAQKLSSLEMKVNSISNSEVMSLGSRLDSLKELISKDISDVFNSFSNDSFAVCDKSEQQETKLLIEMKENIVQEVLGYTCGGTGGWRRVVYLDMTDPDTSCPSGWNMTDYSKRSCGRAGRGWGTCDSVFFAVNGGRYNQVCGRIRAYQSGLPDAFSAFASSGKHTIYSAYVDGIALVHGSPRQHIWTFAAGGQSGCPCDRTAPGPVPPFVGNDYFCESGYVASGYANRSVLYGFHDSNSLWDGRDCHSSSRCCSQNNPPFFTKTLNQKTSDDLELRMCFFTPIERRNVDVGVELYVKQDVVFIYRT